MNIKQLEYFYKTCKYKSISQAASSLYLSQPSLSYSLKSLENELGVKLFDRSLNGITLTKNGEKVLSDTEIILDIVHDWSLLSDHITRLNLEAEGFLTNFLIPRLILDLSQTHPDVNVYSNGDSIYSRLSQNATIDENPVILFDILAGDTQTTEKNALQKGWKYRKLTEIPSYLLVNVNNPLLKNATVSLTDITSSCTLAIKSPYNVPAYQDLHQLIEQFGQNRILNIPDRHTQMQLVAMSETVVCIATSLANMHNELIDSGKIVAIRPQGFAFYATIAAFYNTKVKDSLLESVLRLTHNYLSECVCASSDSTF